MQEIYSLKIFLWLDKNVVDEILKNSQKEIFSAWEIIFNQNDISNWKWYIISVWEAEVYINWNLISTLWAWEIFWEIALLNEEKRTATIKAKTFLETIILTQDNIFEMINNWNESINKDIMDRLEQNLINNY